MVTNVIRGVFVIIVMKGLLLILVRTREKSTKLVGF